MTRVGILLVAVSLAAFTVLFLLGRGPNSARHAARRDQLAGLARLDALIETEILSITTGRTASYDRLDRLRAERAARQGRLRADLADRLAGADAALARSEKAIESFKRHDAVLRSSVLYLPEALRYAHERLDADPAARQLLAAIGEQAMRMLGSPHAAEGDAGRRLSGLVEQLAARQPSAGGGTEPLVRHMAVIRREKSRVDAVVAAIQLDGRRGLHEGLMRSLEAEHVVATTTARRFGLILFAFGLCFVLAAVVITRRHLRGRRRAEQEAKEMRGQLAANQRELEIAAHIQTSVLPRDLNIDGLAVAAAMVPASEVGGDYYDVVAAPDGCWIGIGDVTGHGLNSGLIMMMVQSALAGLVRHDPDGSPGDLLQRLNEVMYENIRRRLGVRDHVTFSLIRYHNDGNLEYVGAHEEMIVCRADGGCERLDTSGAWLGGLPDVRSFNVTGHLRLEAGDLVALYTDGITEAMNASGEPFGVERLCEVLEAVRDRPLDAIEREVFARVAAWSAAQEDDRTLLLFRYEPSAIPARAAA